MLTTHIASIRGIDELLGVQLTALCRSVVLYVSRICSSADLKRTASGLIPLDVFNEFKSWLDGSSYTLDRFRRAIIFMVRYRDRLTWGSAKMYRITARKFEVEREDCELVCDLMTPKDMRQMKKIRGNLNYKRNPLLDTILTDGDIEKHCNRVAWKKLRFLAKHDQALSGGTGRAYMDTLIGELRTEAARLALYYADFTVPLQLKNYIRRGVTNYAMRLIEYHTAAKRARIRQSKSEEREFDVVVTGLTGIEADDYEVVSGEQMDAKIQLDAMRNDPELAPMVDALLGKDPRFNLWAQNLGLDLSQVPTKTWVQYAADWAEVDLGQLRERKAEFLVAA